MGNYICNDSTRKNALILIADYMTNGTLFKWGYCDDRFIAIEICKDIFKRVYKCSCSPIYTLEKMHGEYDAYKDKCGKVSIDTYTIGIEVIDDILKKMS